MATSSDGAKKRPTRAKKTTTKKTQTKLTAPEAIAKTEKAVDTFVQKMNKKAAGHVSNEIRDTATNVAHQASSFANEVEKIGDSVASPTDNILPPNTGTEGTYEATYGEHVSRLFIFRCLWLIIQIPVLFVWSIWYTIISIIHYISMFLTGKRTRNLRETQTRYRRHVVAWKSYMNALTDKRPAIIVD